MATGGPELRLDVSLNIDGFKRTALPALVKAASEFEFPIAIKFNRDSITNELRLLGRQLGQRKYRIDLDDTSIKNAIDSANKLAGILNRTKGTLARAKALGEVVGMEPRAGGPNAAQVKTIYGAAKEQGIVSGTANRTRAALAAELTKGFAEAGGDAVEGLIKGILSKQGELGTIGAGLGDTVVNKLKESLEIRSPSRRLFGVGQQAGQGFNNGLIAALDVAARNASAVINASMRSLDRMVQRRQRIANSVRPGDAGYETAQMRLGSISGRRELAQSKAEVLQLESSARQFEAGSSGQLSKLLQAAQIQANNITPNTTAWNALQGRISDLNIQLQTSAKLAEEIQMRRNLAAFDPKSLSGLESRLVILKSRAKDLNPELAPWRELNKEIQRVERGIEKASRKPLTKGQRFGAAGGAFLYGGGLGGGFGSALGGIAGGLAGGVPGAFTGAAVGQAADDIGRSIGAMTDEAATISKLQKGLAIASNDLRDYASASAEVERISNRLLIPIEEVYRKFTQLKASTVALNIDAKTTGEIFEGTAAAVLQSGGSLEDVDGAMRAVVQVFSKGKLSAEELRGQLGERLPGAVVEFAQSAGMSVQELDKAFESGATSLDDFVVFLKQKNQDTKKFVNAMATDSQYAGARMAKAFEAMRLNIGGALQTTGAAFQNFATGVINAVNKVIEKLIELRIFNAGANTLVKEAMEGKNGGIAGLVQKRDKIKGEQGKVVKGSLMYSMFGDDIREVEKALKIIKDLQNLTKKRKAQPNSAATDDKQAEKIVDALQKKEEALADARVRREEEIADIRKKAIEQAKQIEEDFAKQKLSREREIAKAKRDTTKSEKTAAFNLESIKVGLAGGDTEIIAIQQKVSNIASQRQEEKIALEEKILDEQSERAKKIEDLKLATASAVNESNARYAKAIGQSQQDYALSVAKIIDKGTENASKRLVIGAQIAALYSQRAVLNQEITSQTGLSIPAPQDGQYNFSGEAVNRSPADILISDRFKSSYYPVAEILTIDKKIEKLSASLSKNMAQVAVSVKPVTVNIDAATRKVNAASQALTELDRSYVQLSSTAREKNDLSQISEEAKQIVQNFIGTKAGLSAQIKEAEAILVSRKAGLSEEQARQNYEILLGYREAFTRESVLYSKAIANAANGEEKAALGNDLMAIREQLKTARDEALGFANAINNIPASIQLSVAILDIKDKLGELLDPVKQIISVSDSIASSFGESFKGIINGSTTAQQALAGLFQSVANSFADMAAQIITQYLKMQLIQGLTSLFNLGGGAATMGGSGFFNPKTGLGVAGPNFGLANGGIIQGKFMPITPFADGGIVRGPTMGLVGEGRYNEAVVPLPDGRSIPVDFSGGSGGAPTVIVNVDAKGSQVEGNEQNANQLGRVISAAVQSELIKQQRPGGLLSR